MNYIGSKYSLLNFIETSIRQVAGTDKKVFCDLFAGTGAVGMHFKKLGYQVGRFSSASSAVKIDRRGRNEGAKSAEEYTKLGLTGYYRTINKIFHCETPGIYEHIPFFPLVNFRKKLYYPPS